MPKRKSEGSVTRTSFAFRCTPEWREWLDHVAKMIGVSTPELIVNAIDFYVTDRLKYGQPREPIGPMPDRKTSQR